MSWRRTLAVVLEAAAWLVPVMAETAGPPGPSPGYPFERYLNIRSAVGGSLSPDADRIAFLANITGLNQVWMVGAASGWPDQITSFPDRVQWVRWSPTGAWLAFGKNAGGNERTQLYLASPDGSRIEPLTSNPKAIHTFGGWSHDGTRIAYASNERAEAYFDIYVMDIASRKATRVLTHDSDNVVAAWSSRDRALVISRANASQDNDCSFWTSRRRRRSS